MYDYARSRFRAACAPRRMSNDERLIILLYLLVENRKTIKYKNVKIFVISLFVV